MRDTSKAWLVKVYTDLGTRLLVVIEPHLRVKDLQATIEHDHRAAYPGCGDVKCQLLYVLEVEDGRDIPSSVHSRYSLQDVLRRDGARVYAEFLDKAAKYTACQYTPHQQLQIALSPADPHSDVGNRSFPRSPAELASQPAFPLNGPHTQPHAPVGANGRSITAANGGNSHEQPANLLIGPYTQPHAPVRSNKRSLGGANKGHSQEQAVKKVRLNHEREACAGQAAGTAGTPNLPANHGPLTAGGHRTERLQDLSQSASKAAVATHSVGRALHSQQPGPESGLPGVETAAASEPKRAASMGNNGALASANGPAQGTTAAVGGQAAGRMGPPGRGAPQESSSSSDAQRGAAMPAQQGLRAVGGLAEAAPHPEGSTNMDDPPQQQEQAHQPPQASIVPGVAQQPTGAQVTARELGTVQRKKGAAQASPAEIESSSEKESSEEDPPPGRGLAVPMGTEQQELSLPAQVPQKQQGPVRAAAQGQIKAPGAAAHDNSSSSEASSSSSEEEDSLEPPPSKAAPVPQPVVPSSALQHLQPGAAPSALQGNGGRKEGASSSDSASKSSSPEEAAPAGQCALHGLPAGRQQAAAQQAGVHHQDQAAQNSSSSGEEESYESSEEGQPPQPAQQLALARQRAVEAAAAADDSASEDESSSPEQGRDAPELARQPGQGSRGRLQNGVLGGKIQAASGSSSKGGEDDEESDEGQLADKGPVKQAADKATGKPAAAAQKNATMAAQEQHIPITRSSKRRAEQHDAVNGQAAARKGEKSKDSAPEQAAPPGGALSAEAEAPAAPPETRTQGRESKHAKTHNGAAHAAKGRDTRSGAAHQAAPAPAQQQEDAAKAAKRRKVDQGRPQQATAFARDAAMAEESSSSSEEERQETPRTWPAGAAKGMAAAANDEPSPSGSEEAGTPRNGIYLLSQEDQDRLKKYPLEAVLAAKAEQSLQKRQSTARQPRRQNGDAGADGNRADGSQERSPTPQVSDRALLGRALKKMSEADKAAQEAKIKQHAQSLFLEEPGKLKDKLRLRKALQAGLPLIVGYEQGLALKTAGEMFKEAKRPPWWPLEKWTKDQLDRALHPLVKVYTAAQKQWQAMQKAHALR